MDQFENAQRQRQPTSTIGLADSVGRDLRYSFRSLLRRPTFTLAHQATRRAPDAVLVVERQVYVSQSYNAAQSVLIARAAGERTLLVVEVRSATEQRLEAASHTGRAHHVHVE